MIASTSAWMLYWALVLGPAPQSKQPLEIHPGDPAVNGSFIQPYTNQWKMIQKSADGSRSQVGRWTDQVKIVDQDGEQRIERIQVMNGPQGQSEMVNQAVRRTLEPRSFRSSGSGAAVEVVFDGTHVRMGRPDLSNPKTIDLKMPAFDWTLYGLLLAAFPLEENYSAKFPYFDGNISGLHRVEWMSFEVQGREEVDAGANRRVEAWLAVTKQGWKFWLTKAPPYIIRLEIPTGNGAAQIWEME